jgi:hypothetical protein
MAEPTQYAFDLEEIAELLVKKAGLVTGHWTVGVNFGIGVASVGQDQNRVRPSAIIGVEQLILTRATGPGPLTIDAAKFSESTERPR